MYIIFPLTLGKPRRDASGAITNSVLLLHGTSGLATDLVQPLSLTRFTAAGEPLDLSRYFLKRIAPHFPHCVYRDPVRAQHLLLEKIGIKT
jgi:homoserine O-acetyltransferase/O-succinyltransferase